MTMFDKGVKLHPDSYSIVISKANQVGQSGTSSYRKLPQYSTGTEYGISLLHCKAAGAVGAGGSWRHRSIDRSIDRCRR